MRSIRFSNSLITVLLIGCITIQNYAQNWQPSNATASNAFPIVDLATHKGNIFTTVNQAFLGVIKTSTDDGSTWTTLSPAGIGTFATYMATTNDRLYLASNHLLHSLLHYSTNKGQTFTLDTQGLPAGNGGGVQTIFGLQVFDNRLFVAMGSAGYYVKDLSKTAGFSKIDTPTLLNTGTDKLAFYNGVLYTYDNAGAKIFYSSNDFGKTWNAITTNLPTDLRSQILEINATTGRIYLSGESKFSGNVASEYGLYYSDDQGKNWTKMDLSATASTNHLGGFHKVTALFARDKTLYIAFDNDAKNSVPDVISTQNLGTTALQEDTTGLPTDPSGSVHGARFLIHKAKLLLALNLIDIYAKGITLSTSEVFNTSSVQVSPSVIKDQTLHIHTILPLQVAVFDTTGKQLLKTSVSPSSSSVSLQKLPAGIFFVHLIHEGKKVIQKIIKKH